MPARSRQPQGLGECGYEADCISDCLNAKRIEPRMPGAKTRAEPISHDKRRHRRRSRIFGRLKYGRRVAAAPTAEVRLGFDAMLRPLAPR